MVTKNVIQDKARITGRCFALAEKANSMLSTMGKQTNASEKIQPVLATISDPLPAYLFGSDFDVWMIKTATV